MDKTKESIKMCDCPEIQEGHKDSEGDLYAYYYNDRDGLRELEFIRYSHPLQNPQHYSHLESIWLPRQDQLQEMIEDVFRFGTSVRNITIAINFAKFCGIYDEDSEGSSNIHIRKGSIEQLWLAFVMKEKYNKSWNGDEWLPL